MAATPFQKEAWSKYSIGMVVLLLRIFARCSAVGLKWEGDDYFAAISVLFWTVWRSRGVVIGAKLYIQGELIMLELISKESFCRQQSILPRRLN